MNVGDVFRIPWSRQYVTKVEQKVTLKEWAGTRLRGLKAILRSFDLWL